jgi:hypothetical protein
LGVGGGGGGSGGAAAGHGAHNDTSNDEANERKEAPLPLHHHELSWCPSRISSLPIWLAKTQTNIAREAQVAGLLVQNPLGEQREVFSERFLLTQPLRLSVGWDPSNGPLWCTGGDEEDDGVDDDQSKTYPHSLTVSGAAATGAVHIIDRSLLLKLRRSRREAIARSALLPSRIQAGGDGSAAAAAAAASRARGVMGTQHKSYSSSSAVLDTSAPPATASSRFQPLDFTAILSEHCWIVLHQAWGRSSHLLIPRRPPAVVTAASQAGYSWEEECNTVQLLRYQRHTNTWEVVIPFLTENKISATTAAVAATLHQFRSRVSVPCNVMTSGAATALCSAREQLQLSRGTTLSTKNECEVARLILTQLRQRSHFDTLVALDKQLAASRMTYRARRQAKEQEEAKKARSAKAKKDAETRELLDALSSEKKEAYALLQRLDLDIGSAASSSDRLSLLALASTAADKLERERAAQRSIAMRRFAQLTRVRSEEQSPRYLLQPGDVILLSGGSSLVSQASSSPSAAMGSTSCDTSLAATARRVAELLPKHSDMLAFAVSRVDEQQKKIGTAHAADGANFRRNSVGVGSPRGSDGMPQSSAGSAAARAAAAAAPIVAPWPSLDALNPLLGNTLLYVYNGSH